MDRVHRVLLGEVNSQNAAGVEGNGQEEIEAHVIELLDHAVLGVINLRAQDTELRARQSGVVSHRELCLIFINCVPVFAVVDLGRNDEAAHITRLNGILEACHREGDVCFGEDCGRGDFLDD